MSARKSLRQIESLNAHDPKASLLAALDEPSKRAYPWTRSLVRRLYRDEYKRSVLARFRRGERSELSILRSLAAEASELKERGLTLSDAGKRPSAAAAEWESTENPKSLAELIAIVRDKALVSDEKFPVRGETITLLQRIAPVETRVRDALPMMVVDITDDTRVRDQAARALREYGVRARSRSWQGNRPTRGPL